MNPQECSFICLLKKKEFGKETVAAPFKKQCFKVLTSNVVDLGSFHSKFLLGVAVYCRKNTLG